MLENSNFIIKIFSDHVNKMIEEKKMTLNGVIYSPIEIMFEFCVVIDDEDIIFEAYYNHNNQLLRLHVDEDYSRSFFPNFKKRDFESVDIKIKHLIQE